MPEATSKYSTDYYLYNYLVNPIANKICFINPNFITFLSTLLIIPIVQNLVNKGSIAVFISLMLLRFYLDCLDGSIARECNKKSNFGAIFDVASDGLLFIILNCIIIYNIIYYKNKNIQNILIGILFIYSIFEIIKQVILELINKRSIKDNYIDGPFKIILHDNCLVFIIVYSLFCKLYI
jgi:phosphatidylglycerophosphate synthase